MSALLGAVFILILLILGYAFNAWPLISVILVMVSGIAGILAIGQIEEVKADWENRRCDFDVMIAGQLYKKADDPRSAGEFASENFSFCMRSMFKSILESMLAPLYSVLGKELDVTKMIEETLNRMREIQAMFMTAFQKMLDPFWQRFRMIASQLGINFQIMMTAMKRVAAIAVSTLYMGMGLTIGIENFVAFIIKVVMIILYIILSVLFILIIGIIPFFPIIFAVCYTIGNSPFGYMVDDVCGELCFDPQTMIYKESGDHVQICTLKVGDSLEDGGRVEGVLRVKGSDEPMYRLGGVHVSGAHLVWHAGSQDWIPVAKHPNAVRSSRWCSTLICLRTSTRNIPIRISEDEVILFRDWEELPRDNPSVDTIWESLVSTILNKKASSQAPPEEHPMVHGHCEVLLRTGERIPVQSVRIGDEIYSTCGFTKVKGIYVGEAEYEGFFTDGVWLQSIPDTTWSHPTSSGTRTLQPAYHLLTESGCFWIQTKDFSGFVRDFTEVGAENLFLTYSYTRKLLKKSFSREESCVSDSLSQVLSSCLQPIY